MQKQKKLFKSQREDGLYGLIFDLPFIIGLVVIFIPMVIEGIRFAFSSVSFDNGLKLTNIGLYNFKYALRVDPDYIKLLFSDIKDLLLNFPIILVFSLFVAVLLNSKVWGKGIFRVLFFLPVITSTGLLAAMDADNNLIASVTSAVANTDSNVLSSLNDITAVLESLKFSPELIGIVAGFANNILDIVNRSGVQILIFLAGIQSISPSLYEAANVEGASSWEVFWKITLPMITPMLIVNIIYTFVESITRSSTKMMTYINKVAFNQGEFGYASAMSWIHFLLIAVILTLVFVFYLVANKRKEKGVK